MANFLLKMNFIMKFKWLLTIKHRMFTSDKPSHWPDEPRRVCLPYPGKLLVCPKPCVRRTFSDTRGAWIGSSEQDWPLYWLRRWQRSPCRHVTTLRKISAVIAPSGSPAIAVPALSPKLVPSLILTGDLGSGHRRGASIHSTTSAAPSGNPSLSTALIPSVFRRRYGWQHRRRIAWFLRQRLVCSASA